MTRLVQIKKGSVRRAALVEEPRLRLLDNCSSIYELAQVAIAAGLKLSDVARQRARQETLDYDAVYSGCSEWRLLPAIDHPHESSCCLISGTGLTHLGSARGRQSMHEIAPEQLTDSMRIFRWGLEGGRPAAGCIGVPPEWFYKGTRGALRAHGEPLDIPAYAEDGGEEAEVAGIYVIGQDGQPYRIGLAPGNEFSDHQFEKKNYLNLAASKLRTCSLGPELWWIRRLNRCPLRSRSKEKGRFTGARRSRPGRPRCATACRILSITISSLKRTVVRATCTCIFSAPTISASAIRSACETET